MSNNSKIEWTDATWNPVMGCTPISPACDHCYARAMIKRFGGCNKGFPERPDDVTLYPERLKRPLCWKKPRRVFVCSMSDLFHEDVPDEYIGDVWKAMAKSTQHTFMVLTKRPERMLRWFSQYWIPAVNYKPDSVMLPNVWLGVTAENQEYFDYRTSLLKQCRAPVLFVSIEPMLGQIDYDGRLDLVICGGETGPGARPMKREWAESLLDQCLDTGTPFFFKGWGTATLQKSDSAYRLLLGQTWEQIPEATVGQGRLKL